MRAAPRGSTPGDAHTVRRRASAQSAAATTASRSGASGCGIGPALGSPVGSGSPAGGTSPASATSPEEQRLEDARRHRVLGALALDPDGERDRTRPVPQSEEAGGEWSLDVLHVEG